MAFCQNCGAQVEGRFCAKCGTPLAVAPGQTPPPPAQPAISAPGLQDNMAAALCYICGIVTGILFLVLEPYNRNRNIRFHAFQSIFLWVAWLVIYIGSFILSAILGSVPVVGWIFSIALHSILWLAFLIVWLVVMYKAYNNERWVLPVIGPLAEKQA